MFRVVVLVYSQFFACMSGKYFKKVNFISEFFFLRKTRDFFVKQF